MFRQKPIKQSNFVDSPQFDPKRHATMVDRDLSHLFLYTQDLSKLPHLMQSDSTDQAIANVANAQVITFDTDVHHSGIARTSASRFTIETFGSYLICFSGITLGVINEYIHVWLRINGNDVANSNTIYQYKSNSATNVVAVSFIEHFDTGDYFEFWTWGTNVGNKWDATAAVAANPGVSPARPACPSIIITCNFVGTD